MHGPRATRVRPTPRQQAANVRTAIGPSADSFAAGPAVATLGQLCRRLQATRAPADAAQGRTVCGPSADAAHEPTRTITDDSPVEIIAASGHQREDTASTMTTLDIKALQPQLPPGRANRKALAYTPEIQRLRALGYTFDAIRLALLDIGIVVGLTTVKREAAHGIGHACSLASAPAAGQTHYRPASPPEERAGSGPGAARRSGKDIAEAFAQSHLEHPLVRQGLPRTARKDDSP